ncbi:MAG: hypothetical protein AAF927_30680 [Bacteroidota bacterium]
MKRNLALFLSLFAFSFFLPAQTIEMEKRMGELQFYQDGTLLTTKSLLSVLEVHPEAFALAKKGKRNLYGGVVLGGAGGVLLGVPVGIALSGNEPVWGLLGAGVGLCALAYAFGHRSNKQFKSAVQSYNQSLGILDSRSFQPQYSLISDNDGFGLQIRF